MVPLQTESLTTPVQATAASESSIVHACESGAQTTRLHAAANTCQAGSEASQPSWQVNPAHQQFHNWVKCLNVMVVHPYGHVGA